MREIDLLFDKYSESHQNTTNKLIHWICVPTIVFSLLGLVWIIPFPHLSFLGEAATYINWATFLILFSMIYYFRLSRPLALAMILVVGAFSAIIVSIEINERSGGPALWLICLLLFSTAWIGQFIGHAIEGKKPSFFDDIRFLLIGPLWLLHFVFNAIGLKY